MAIYGCGVGSSTVLDNNCEAPEFTTQTAEQLLSAWGAGLQAYDIANNPDIYTSAGYFTMSFYLPEAILQPTKSPDQRYGTQQIYDYFTNFLAENPIMTFNSESNVAHSLGCGFGSYVGYYTFVLNPGTSYESTVEARFSFTYEYMGSSFNEQFIVESGLADGHVFSQTNLPNWYILTHHSSALPIIH